MVSSIALQPFQIYPQETLRAAIYVFNELRGMPDLEEAANDFLDERTYPLTVAVNSPVSKKIETIRLHAQVLLSVWLPDSDWSYDKIACLRRFLHLAPIFYDSGLTVDEQGSVIQNEPMMLKSLSAQFENSYEFKFHFDDLQWELSLFEGWLDAANIKSNLYPSAELRVGDWKAHQKEMLENLAEMTCQGSRKKLMWRIKMELFKIDDEQDIDDSSTDSGHLTPPSPSTICGNPVDDIDPVDDGDPGDIEVSYFATLKTRKQSVNIIIEPGNNTDEKILSNSKDMWTFMAGKGYADKMRLEDIVGMAGQMARKAGGN